MSGLSTADDGFSEPCAACGRDTDHAVSIELKTESRKEENAAYSREPYRVSTCNRCGLTTTVRMNNA